MTTSALMDKGSAGYSDTQVVDETAGEVLRPLRADRSYLCTELLYAADTAPPETSSTIDIFVPSCDETLVAVPIR